MIGGSDGTGGTGLTGACDMGFNGAGGTGLNGAGGNGFNEVGGAGFAGAGGVGFGRGAGRATVLARGFEGERLERRFSGLVVLTCLGEDSFVRSFLRRLRASFSWRAARFAAFFASL